MMLETDFLTAIELHSSEQLKAALSAGLDFSNPIRGKPATQWLTEMYTRTDRFPQCLKVLLDAGATVDDPKLLPVLMNDAQALTIALRADAALVHHRTTLISAFTPLEGATLLHVAAEYGHAAVARVLLDHGANPNTCAAVDAHDFNGHTPIFHTVNANDDHSAPVRKLLLTAGAKCDVFLRGLVWGRGFEWETTFFDVTPISYAQLGTLPQIHRDETTIRNVIEELLRAAGRTVPPRVNVPNEYLNK